MKRTLTVVFLVAACSGIVAQYQEHCGSELLHIQSLTSDPQYRIGNASLESGYRSAMVDIQKEDRRSAGIIYTLPVVVHIIHNNGIENISDTRVYNALDWLNDAFRNRGYYNTETGVDIEVEFCLATQAPDGTPTSGINRIQSESTNMAVEGFTELHELISWDTRSYINIWVVRNVCIYGMCGYGGFAHLPGGHGSPDDGIVIRANTAGLSESWSKALIHEMGHFLGLHHTFYGGCRNDDCLRDGDRVCDTPPSRIDGVHHCMFDVNSCTTDSDDPSIYNPLRAVALGGIGDQPDMMQNYMAYSHAQCTDRFTGGQKARMRFFIEGARSRLLESFACAPPCHEGPVIASFTTGASEVFTGDPVMLTNTSANATGYQWYLDGNPYTTDEHLTLSFTETGVYLITLEAFRYEPECRSDTYAMAITVKCPVKALFDYMIEDNAITMTDLSTNHAASSFLIDNAEGDTVFSADGPDAYYTFEAPGRYRICTEAIGQYCRDRYCRIISVSGAGFCDPGEDEDGDGLVGYFDPDCPCEHTAFQAQCATWCQLEFTPDSNIAIKLKYVSDPICNFISIHPNFAVGDINGNGNVEIVTTSSLGASIVDATNFINVLNGSDGSLEKQIDVPSNILNWSSFSHILMHRNINNSISIVIGNITDTGQYLEAYDYAGTPLWQTQLGIEDVSALYRAMNAADINQNGFSEIYLGASIFNSENGRLLASGTFGRGINKNGHNIDSNFGHCVHSVAADLLPQPGLELAAGNTVYIVEINNLSDSSGNVMVPVIADPPVLDGLTAVGDINGDGLLDVVVVRSNDYPDGGGIWVWDPRTRGLIAQADAGPGGGIPFIGDVDGDCFPEIGIVFQHRLNMYQYDGTTELKLMYSIPIIDDSGATGMTMFDLNGDGRQELIYRDEEYLYIIDAPTGNILTTTIMKSGTMIESPVIADIDGNGQANILVNGSMTGLNETRIYAFESAGAPWVPARSVWNQTGYHVTNVNDDLTIPRIQQNIATPIPGTEDCLLPTCPQVYNNFLVQATMRTQQGCIQYPALDLAVEIISYDCMEDSIVFCLVIHNLSDVVALTDTLGICCIMLSDNDEFWYAECEYWYIPLDPLSSSDTLCITGPLPDKLDIMYVVINDDGSSSPFSFPITDILECDYTNNVETIVFDIHPLTIDLGPDIVKCASEVVTFYADVEGAVAWLWQDGSTESLFSTALPGTYFVEAFDKCGRPWRDTVRITIDTQAAISLGPDITICPGDTLQFSLDIDTGWVRWFPATLVDCDTCASVVITTDTTAMLIAVTGYDACISADTVLITVLQPEVSEISAAICPGDSILFFDTALYDAGTYMHTTDICDSLYILTLDVHPADSVSMMLQICEGDSVAFGGSWLSTEGSYVFEFANANGCDSVITVDLIVDDILTDTQSITLCNGDSVFVHDMWLSAAGVYESIISTDPCLHILQTTIEVYPTYFSEQHYVLCPGDSVWIDGVWHSSPDAFALYLQTAAGCDSTLAVTITTDEMYQKEEKYILCPGDSVQIEGAWYDVSAILTFLHPAIDGCDTLLTIVIETIPSPPSPQMEIDCDTAAIILTLDTSGPWQAQWDNGETGSHAMYFNGTTAVLHLYADPGCVHIEEIALLPIPDIDAVPVFHDITTPPGTLVVIASELDPTDWTVTWNSPALLSCTQCATTELTTHHNVPVGVLMEHISGCVFTAQFLVSVEDTDDSGVYIPNVFTPNGDGINDTWMIFPADETLTFDEVLIFDRWGDLVARWQNTAIVSWDGIFRDKPLNPGVFVYVVRYTDGAGERKVLYGDITLLR